MKRVIYFTDDFGQENIDKAKSMGLMIRDIRVYGHDDFLEQCDVVTGDAPKEYRDRYEFVEFDKLNEALRPPEDKTVIDKTDSNAGQGISKPITPDEMRAEMTEAGYEFNNRLGDKKIAKVYEDFKGV